jgi:hypothetical protein
MDVLFNFNLSTTWILSYRGDNIVLELSLKVEFSAPPQVIVCSPIWVTVYYLSTVPFLVGIKFLWFYVGLSTSIHI